MGILWRGSSERQGQMGRNHNRNAPRTCRWFYAQHDGTQTTGDGYTGLPGWIPNLERPGNVQLARRKRKSRIYAKSDHTFDAQYRRHRVFTNASATATLLNHHQRDETESESGRCLLYLGIVMTNTSGHDIACDSYWYDNLNKNFRYDVVYEDGQPAEKIVRKTPSSTHPCLIGPGESRSSDGLISRGFDFSRPGKYTIQVSRPVWGDDQRPNTLQTHENDPEIEIKSNIITITVVAPPAEPR